MSDQERGIGAALRAAREAKGWSTHDVGSRLRLMARQIEAIEAEDFGKLGQPVFARGFVRNYARLLGLNPDELLDQMTRVKVAEVKETENVPFAPGAEFWKSPWVWIAALLAVAAIAIPVSLYWWLSGGEEAAAPAAEPALLQPPPPPPAPVLEAPPAAAEPVPGAAPPPAPVPAPQSAAPASAKPVPVPAVRPASALRLQFDDISWVQVHDASGRLVHSGLNPAGSAVEVDGKAPFHMVVGNAEKVRVSYKGRAIDLEPFTAVDVARLTLNP